jgi:hypothetical protein
LVTAPVGVQDNTPPEGAVIGTGIGLLTAGVPMAEIMSFYPLAWMRTVLVQFIGRPSVLVHRILRKSAAFAAVSLVQFIQSA